MPHIYTKEELKEKRKQIRGLNAEGKGLNNENTWLDLEELKNFMQRAHNGLEVEWGSSNDPREKELLLYLKDAQKAFELLQKKDIVSNPELVSQENSDLEIALHTLSGLREKLLQRDSEGRPMLETVVRYGVDEDKPGFDRNQVVGALDNLDKILDVGLDGIGAEADRMQTKESMALFEQQKVVIAFQNDPYARLIATAIVNPDGDAGKAFKKAMKRIGDSRFKKQVEDMIWYAGNTKRSPIERRSYFLRAVRYAKLLHQLTGAPDPEKMMEKAAKGKKKSEPAKDDAKKQPEPAADEAEALFSEGDMLLKQEFDENSERVIGQVAAFTDESIKLELPKNVSKERFFFALANDGTTPDLFYAVRDMLEKEEKRDTTFYSHKDGKELDADETSEMLEEVRKNKEYYKKVVYPVRRWLNNFCGYAIEYGNSVKTIEKEKEKAKKKTGK